MTIDRPNRMKIRACCCVSTILILAAIATLLAQAITTPTYPHFVIDKASISTAANNLTSALSLHVRAYNPNAHYWAYYDAVMVSVYGANDTLLAYQLLPDPKFSHHPKTQLLLNSGPVAHNASAVTDGSVEVRVRAATRFKIKGWKKLNGVLKITCSPVAVEVNSSDSSGARQTPCVVLDYGFDC